MRITIGNSIDAVPPIQRPPNRVAFLLVDADRMRTRTPGSQNCQEQFWSSDRMSRRPKLMDELSNSRQQPWIFRTAKHPPSGGFFVW